MTAQSQNMQTIPLNRLLVSADNARRTDRKADIEALAASIASHGLLQNLSVTAADKDRFAVVAGGRRLAAMKWLAKSGVIAKDYPVPCRVIAADAGKEASLVENVHRVAMEPIDEVEAFAALVAEGSTNDQVAHRFGVTVRHVDQRLALAGLSPKIKAACKRGEVSLDAARAFCLVADHAQQDAVFRSLGKPLTHASAVRARLMEGRMRGGDSLASFVGLDAYEAAGGRLARDLFDDEAVYVEDPALIHKLAVEKLESLEPAYIAAGWGWVEINLGHGHVDGLANARLQPEWRDPTEEEEAELTRLRAELDELDEALDRDSVENDPRWDKRDDIAAAIETIRQAARVFDPDLMALAGVVLSVTRDGEVTETVGAVRKVDEKAVRAVRQRKEGKEERVDIAPDNREPAEPALNSSGIPKSVLRDLSAVRTKALRVSVASDPYVALALAVAAMASRAFLRSDLSGIAVAAHPAHIHDLDAMAARWSELGDGMPDDEGKVLDWSLAQSSEQLLSVLAVLVAGAIDLTHERGSLSDRRRQVTADTLAQAVGLDMNKFWVADLDYWTKLPKAELLSTLSTAPAIAELSEVACEMAVRAHAKLKKDDLAAKVCEAFAGTAYLPDVLVTPSVRGDFVLTQAGIDEIAA